MNSNTLTRFSRSLILGISLLFLSMSSWVSAQDPTTKIVIDASRDGGTWWFPQRESGFDSSKPHQGKALVEYLKKFTPTVVEIVQGGVITNQLTDATVVVRFNVNGEPYSPQEVTAYKNYVENGGRVLLVYAAPVKGPPDAVAETFGIRVGQRAETPFIKKWANDPITVGLKDVPFTCGSVISVYPKTAIQLGMMANGQSVFGVVEVGKGKVVYLGSIAPLLSMSQPFVENVFSELFRK